MMEKIKKNFFLAAVAGGAVVASYYSNSRDAIAEVKLRHPGCDVEVYDVSSYGFSFGDAPVIRIEGGMLNAVRCVETGTTYRTVKECCEQIGVPLKTLYTAIRRGSRVYGYHYEYRKYGE